MQAGVFISPMPVTRGNGVPLAADSSSLCLAVSTSETIVLLGQYSGREENPE